MIGAEENTAHAIYFCSNNKLNLTNSKLEIKNYQQDALEWDGGDGGYNVNITNSTFISDHNRSGFTGTFTAKIDNSEVDVINSTGNGSNGSHFEIVNGSVVEFNNNGSHGLSAGNLTIDKSTVEAIGNGANGVHVAGKLEIKDNSNVAIQGNKCTISSRYTIPGALYIAGESKITESTVTITKNEGSGIYQKSGSLTVDLSAKLTIKNNKAVKLGYGGGVNVNGTMNLPANVELYNNHADAAGDDIYSTNTITFGAVGSNWILDDCNHKIDGWYKDGMPEGEGKTGNRWCGTYDGKVCVSDGKEYMESMLAGGYETAIALKAAHGAQTTPPTPTPYSGSSSSGNTYSWYTYPTPTPVPVAVIMPKTGDMTIWQSILQFLGIR